MTLQPLLTVSKLFSHPSLAPQQGDSVLRLFIAEINSRVNSPPFSPLTPIQVESLGDDLAHLFVSPAFRLEFEAFTTRRRYSIIRPYSGGGDGRALWSMTEGIISLMLVLICNPRFITF